MTDEQLAYVLERIGDWDDHRLDNDQLNRCLASFGLQLVPSKINWGSLEGVVATEADLHRLVDGLNARRIGLPVRVGIRTIAAAPPARLSVFSALAAIEAADREFQTLPPPAIM